MPNEEIKDKLDKLKSLLKELGSLLVAYSGGVDSAFVASLHHKILDGSALAELRDLGYTYIPGLHRLSSGGQKGFTTG